MRYHVEGYKDWIPSYIAKEIAKDLRKSGKYEKVTMKSIFPVGINTGKEFHYNRIYVK
jgi:hypothetical protein